MLDNPDTQARVFYISILGIAILAYLFNSYRHRMGQALQHAMIWGLIFVGVVLAFGFKDSLTTALYDDRPRQIDSETISLKRGRDGHFHANAEVNGRPMTFLIDTGATNLVLSREDAQAVGIDTENLSYSLTSMTANGPVKSAPVRLNSVALGDFTDHDLRATVNGGGLDISLMGMSYLNLYQSYQVEGDTMYLRR